MKFRISVVRTLMASAALAAAVALAGCETDGTGTSARSLRPLSREMLSELDKKNMPKESPLLVRLFKQEAELEVWKQDASGHFALLKTYPICRWSGELGPKVREGDRQAPEGFYTITPGQMNPNSQYFLSFNIGYPNDFDRAHGRTGAYLMVHGDCSSRGCYAMTDEQISEIYALARESFFGGQHSFQVQAYPFRMTPVNMAKHRNNPNMPFWRMLKEGYDHFEVTRNEPKVDVCEKRYVFNAEPPANATPFTLGPTNVSAPGALTFNPAGRCPAYQVAPEIAAEVATKTRRDEIEIADLVRKGTPTVPIRTGVDGGMHPVFLAKVRPQEVREPDGTVRMVVDAKAPGTVPSTVNPPRELEPSVVTASVATAPRTAMPPPAAPPSSAVAARPPSGAGIAPNAGPVVARPSPPQSGNMFTRLFSSDGDRPQAAPNGQAESGVGRVTSSVSRFFGVGHDDRKAAPAPHPTAVPTPPPKPAPAARTSVAPARTAAVPAPKAQPQAPPAETPPAVRTSAANGPGILSGAQPVLPAGTFDNRSATVR